MRFMNHTRDHVILHSAASSNAATTETGSSPLTCMIGQSNASAWKLEANKDTPAHAASFPSSQSA
eukprot:2448119-Amphidinium_carterae.1